MSRNKNNNPLDDQSIRQQLHEFQVPYDKASWTGLNAKMDYLDKIHAEDYQWKQQLAGIEVPYQVSNWDHLASRMDALAYKKQLYFGKAIELLSLLFFLIWFIQTQESTEIKFTPEEKDGISYQEQADPPEQMQGTSTTPSPGNEENIPGLPSSTTKTSKSINSIAPPPLSVVEERTSRDTESASSSATLTNLEEQPIVTNSPLDKLHAISQSKPLLATGFLPLLFHSVSSMYSNASNHTPLFVQEDYRKNHENALTDIFKRQQIERKAKFWLGLSVAADRDLIRSPHPTQLSVNHMGRIEQNYHAQIAFIAEYRFFEIQTGVQWMHKEYRSVYEGINEARVLGIPLNIRLKFNQAGIMRGYVMCGFTANYALYANYRETELFLEDPSLFFVNNNYRRNDKGLLPSSRFKNGILEGESVYGNQFYTINIAVGMEIYLNPQYRLFIEQAYFHNLDYGIGPAFDKFSTASTTLGFRFLLKR